MSSNTPEGPLPQDSDDLKARDAEFLAIAMSMHWERLLHDHRLLLERILAKHEDLITELAARSMHELERARSEAAEVRASFLSRAELQESHFRYVYRDLVEVAQSKAVAEHAAIEAPPERLRPGTLHVARGTVLARISAGIVVGIVTPALLFSLLPLVNLTDFERLTFSLAGAFTGGMVAVFLSSALSLMRRWAGQTI